jgi:tRNA(Ile)-lysidine synthase
MILEKFLKNIRNHQLLSYGDRILLAVSGGSDSTAMLHLFLATMREFNLEMKIGHLNHGLRGAESDGDEEFVKELGKTFQIPVIAQRLACNDQAPSVGSNLENWARQRRYEFLNRAAEASGASKIALGHTMNDQAETVLMRLIRGSGTRGLAGMPVIRERKFIRPMLWIKREDIQTYLRSEQFAWREDTSNQNVSFLRNRLRADLIPHLLKSYNPNIVQSLAHAAACLREETDALGELVQSIIAKEATRSWNQIAWQVSRLETYPDVVRRQLIRDSVRQMPGAPELISRNMLESIMELVLPGKSGKSVMIGQLQATRDFDFLVIESRSKDPAHAMEYDYHLEIPGEVRIEAVGSLFLAYLPPQSSHQGCVNRWELLLSPTELKTGLRVRSWRPGDRYSPTGYCNPKKLKELFTERKISRAERHLWPVVTLNDNIVFMKDFPLGADMMPGTPSQRTLRVIIEERKIDA